MARTVNEIQAAIVAEKNARAELAGLTSVSSTAIWVLWTWVIATVFWITESYFDQHRADVLAALNSLKVMNLQWYVTKAKAFQYGYSLPSGGVDYAAVDAAAMIVTEAAATELPNQIRLKVAKGAAGALVPLASGELIAFTAYINRVKAAGVRVNCTSGVGDDLQAGLTIYYDALAIAADGSRIDGTSATPVLDAVNAFLAAIPFNGVIVVNKLVAALSAVEGVQLVKINSLQAKYGGLPYTDVVDQYLPDAGYCNFDVAFFNANISYVDYATL